MVLQNYQNIPITPSYAHGRFMLQRLEMIENDSNDEFVIINNENIFLTDIIDTLRNEMDSAFAFAHNIDSIDSKDEIYNNIFVNSDGLAHGGTLYGIFLNSEGASVLRLRYACWSKMYLCKHTIRLYPLLIVMAYL